MAARSILVDTGPLVCLLSSRQTHHRACVEAFDTLPPRLFTCLPVLTEAAYLLRRNRTQLEELLLHCDGGFLELMPIDGGDMPAIREILRQYADQAFDFADACLMHLANREKIGEVFTLDAKDFGVFRANGDQPLTLVPIAGVTG